MTTQNKAELSPEQLEAFVSKLKDVRSVLAPVARDTGKPNVIRLVVEPEFTESGECAGDIINVLVNGRLGFGMFNEVEDPQHPGEDCIGGSFLGIQMASTHDKIHVLAEQITKILAADLPGEWKFESPFA
jgi:hypothetical protein